MSASVGRDWTRHAADEWQPPHPLAVVAALLVFLIALYIAAQQDTRCREWAQNDPTRVAHCDSLNR